ncbi:MAG: hypothetical protein NZ920_02965 [Aigarchaeota archaeon]|nr:hypothetical protein [Aigarchaeota archaeon]MDW8092416.1 hypothetical protein [Nitrososphaerota archaeon]
MPRAIDVLSVVAYFALLLFVVLIIVALASYMVEVGKVIRSVLPALIYPLSDLSPSTRPRTSS